MEPVIRRPHNRSLSFCNSSASKTTSACVGRSINGSTGGSLEINVVSKFYFPCVQSDYQLVYYMLIRNNRAETGLADVISVIISTIFNTCFPSRRSHDQHVLICKNALLWIYIYIQVFCLIGQR